MTTNANPLKIYKKGNKLAQSIIFIHGFPYDNTIWDAQMEHFSKQFYCIAYDIRGLGDSPIGDGQYTMESFVDDLETLITIENIKNPVLCGMSMGGYIALRAMERYGQKLGGAILCDTVSLADNDEGKLKRANAIKTIQTKGLGHFAADFIPNCYGNDFKNTQPEKIKERIDKSAGFNPVGVIGSLFAMLSRTDTTKAVEDFDKPLIFICGEEDSLTPPQKMQALANHSKSAKLNLIKNAGHMSMVENPNLFNRIVEDFMNENF